LDGELVGELVVGESVGLLLGELVVGEFVGLGQVVMAHRFSLVVEFGLSLFVQFELAKIMYALS
jgi:hypothetical protein